jgi:transposase
MGYFGLVFFLEREVDLKYSYQQMYIKFRTFKLVYIPNFKELIPKNGILSVYIWVDIVSGLCMYVL